MGKIIPFSNSTKILPHFPDDDVREYLAETKSDALLRSSLPGEIADIIARIAKASNTTPSGITRMVMTDWAIKQSVHCPPDGPDFEKAA